MRTPLALLLLVPLAACEPADDPASGPVCSATVDGTRYTLSQKNSSQYHEDYDLFLIEHASINLVFGANAELALTIHLNRLPTAEDVGDHTIPPSSDYGPDLVESAVLLNPARFVTVSGDTLTLDTVDGSHVTGAVDITLADGRGSISCDFDVPFDADAPLHSDPHDASSDDPDIDIDWD